MSRIDGEAIALTAVRAIAVLVVIYLIAPIFVIFPLSFTSGSLLLLPPPSWSVRWYTEFFTDPVWLSALRNSISLAVTTSVLATVLGTMAALGLAKLPPRQRSVVLALLLSPLIVPVIIFGVGVFLYFARMALAGTFVGLAMAHTALAMPLVVLTVSATLAGFDPALVRAGYSCGATPARTFWSITRPLIMPGIVTGAIFSFITSFDEIVCAIFLASPEFRTLPRQIWSGAKETVSPAITVAAVILVISSVVLTLVIELLRRRSEKLMGARL